MDPTAQFVTTVLGALAVFGAFAAWLVHHMDKRLDEANADMNRRFDEANADMNRRFDEANADMNRRFDEANADMNRRFDEANADMNRRFDEAKADTDRRFDEAKADTDRRFDEAKADTRRQFDEANANTRQGFDRMHEDNLRLEKELDSQAAQIADLRQDVGRLQGIVERTYQPARFTVPPVQDARVGDEVREAQAGYDSGTGGKDPERQDEP